MSKNKSMSKRDERSCRAAAKRQAIIGIQYMRDNEMDNIWGGVNASKYAVSIIRKELNKIIKELRSRKI